MKQRVLRLLLRISRTCLTWADQLNGPRQQPPEQLPLVAYPAKTPNMDVILRRLARNEAVPVQELMAVHARQFTRDKSRHRLAIKVNDFAIVITRRPLPSAKPEKTQENHRF